MDETCQIFARLPLDLKTWLQHRAIDNVRSVNGELVHILKQARAQEQPKGSPVMTSPTENAPTVAAVEALDVQ